MKSTIDTKAPKTLYMRHLHCNLKREKLLEERYQQIDQDNRMLLQKMSDIMRKPISMQLEAKKGPSSLNHGTFFHFSFVRRIDEVLHKFDCEKISLLKIAARKAQLKKITYDNHRFLHQLQQISPVYKFFAGQFGFQIRIRNQSSRLKIQQF